MKYKSEIYEVVHHDAVEMFKVGAISKAEMKKFDKMCLVKEPEASYSTQKLPKTGYAATAR